MQPSRILECLNFSKIAVGIECQFHFFRALGAVLATMLILTGSSHAQVCDKYHNKYEHADVVLERAKLLTLGSLGDGSIDVASDVSNFSGILNDPLYLLLLAYYSHSLGQHGFAIGNTEIVTSRILSENLCEEHILHALSASLRYRIISETGSLKDHDLFSYQSILNDFSMVSTKFAPSEFDVAVCWISKMDSSLSITPSELRECRK